MKLVPTALAVAATVLVVPLLTGFATGSAATAPVASSFDAATITTLAANGIELVASTSAAPPGAAVLDSSAASGAAHREFGGHARAVVLGPFTDYANSSTHRRAWQVIVEDTALPGGERGRAWVAIDPESGDVLAARPLLELDAG